MKTNQSTTTYEKPISLYRLLVAFPYPPPSRGESRILEGGPAEAAKTLAESLLKENVLGKR